MNKYGWELSDVGLSQYYKQMDDNRYSIIQLRFDDKHQRWMVFAGIVNINLDLHVNKELAALYETYGFKNIDSVLNLYAYKDIDEVKVLAGDNYQHIIAECLFNSNMNNDLVQSVANKEIGRVFINEFINCEIQKDTNDLEKIRSAIKNVYILQYARQLKLCEN